MSDVLFGSEVSGTPTETRGAVNALANLIHGEIASAGQPGGGGFGGLIGSLTNPFQRLSQQAQANIFGIDPAALGMGAAAVGAGGGGGPPPINPLFPPGPEGGGPGGFPGRPGIDPQTGFPIDPITGLPMGQTGSRDPFAGFQTGGSGSGGFVPTSDGNFAVNSSTGEIIPLGANGARFLAAGGRLSPRTLNIVGEAGPEAIIGDRVFPLDEVRFLQAGGQLGFSPAVNPAQRPVDPATGLFLNPNSPIANVDPATGMFIGAGSNVFRDPATGQASSFTPTFQSTGVGPESVFDPAIGGFTGGVAPPVNPMTGQPLPNRMIGTGAPEGFTRVGGFAGADGPGGATTGGSRTGTPILAGGPGAGEPQTPFTPAAPGGGAPGTTTPPTTLPGGGAGPGAGPGGGPGTNGTAVAFPSSTTDAAGVLGVGPAVQRSLADPASQTAGLFAALRPFEAEETARQLAAQREAFGSLGGRFSRNLLQGESALRGRLAAEFGRNRQQALLQAGGLQNEAIRNALSGLLGAGQLGIQQGQAATAPIFSFLNPLGAAFQQGLAPGLLGAAATLGSAALI